MARPGVLRSIVAAVSVPVTADVEAGYDDVAATITAVLEIGAVGINLEDSTGQVLDDPAVHADRIATARAVAVAAGIDLVINAVPTPTSSVTAPEPPTAPRRTPMPARTSCSSRGLSIRRPSSGSCRSPHSH